MEWHYVAPEQPRQNNFVESFNDIFRDKCLYETSFLSLTHPQVEIAT
ncbi:integrase core domain-containing protein [Pseudochelatococcus sp. G4_1912]